MTPFVVSQVHNLIESLRLLEVFVTAPLGLYSDIRMLRESMQLPEAAELSREETQRRRSGYKSLIDDPPLVALGAMDQVDATLTVLGSMKDRGGAPLTEEWMGRARRVLDRARERVAGDLRAAAAARVTGLYVIVDPEATAGRPVLEVAQAVLRGGAAVIQLRDKTHNSGETLRTARELSSMCAAHGALLIVNDDATVARASDADGLHVGRTDLPVQEARRVLADGQIVGRSNNSMNEVAESQAAGADYLAVGAVFGTATMGKSDRPTVGVEMIAAAKAVASQPVVAIGGVSRDNVAEVVRAGADCVCVVSAVTLADDPESAARALVEAIDNAKS